MSKRRFRVDFELASPNGSITVEADDEEEAREMVEGMCLADLCEHLSFAEREPEIEDVDEVNEHGQSLAALARKTSKK